MDDQLPIATLAGPLNQVLVVRAPEALDHAIAEPLRRVVVDALPDCDDAAVVLDLTRVELITSIGIAALLEIREFCTDRSARLVLAGLREEPRSMLRLLRLEAKFAYAAHVDDAVASVAG